MKKPSVVIAGAVRTPIGNLQGALSSVSAPILGSHVIAETLRRTSLPPSEVDQVFMGHVLTGGVGQAPARQAALSGGVPAYVPATTIGKVCGSGLEAVLLGCQAIRAGDAHVVIAGGMENMSRAPYMVGKHEAGSKVSWKPQECQDSMVADGLWDAYENQHMGELVEELIKTYRLSREAMDDYSVRSYTRAIASWEQGLFAEEVVPVRTAAHEGGILIRQDERPWRFNELKLRKLGPAFHTWGTVTAANASGANDGASAMVLLCEDRARSLGITAMARVVGFSRKASSPRSFGVIQVHAIEDLLAKLCCDVDDIDLFEINEAFAGVPMAVMADLHLDVNRVNVRGGAIALGHPIGASGARIVTTLIHALKQRGKRRGIASVCIGGGEGIALALEVL